MCSDWGDIVACVFNVFYVKASFSGNFMLANASKQFGTFSCEHWANDQLESSFLLFFLYLSGVSSVKSSVPTVKACLLVEKSHINLNVDGLLDKRVWGNSHALGLLQSEALRLLALVFVFNNVHDQILVLVNSFRICLVQCVGFRVFHW